MVGRNGRRGADSQETLGAVMVALNRHSLTDKPPTKILKPQPGPQETFLSSPADVAIYGGAAGGGKTFALLLEAARHARTKGFTAMIFRRTYPEIAEPGGLWEKSHDVYLALGGKPRESDFSWMFPGGGVVKFGHMQYEKTKHKYQGSELCFIGYDELTHFEESQFWYMFSRNRSTCGVTPYIRATTNPNKGHWLRGFIDWWIDEDSGKAIPERSGKLRYMARQDGAVIWADSREELLDRGLEGPRSVTFVAAKLEDNPALTLADPNYRANLMALPRYERAQLLDGSWNAVAAAGEVFESNWFEVLKEAPAPMDGDGNPLYTDARYWDRAATEPNQDNKDPDWTRGVLVRKYFSGRYCVLDVASIRAKPGRRNRFIKNITTQDGVAVHQVLAQDPGSAGKTEVAALVDLLAGYVVKVVPETKAKVTRAGPASAAAENGNIDILEADWNDSFLSELEAFPTPGVHDDQADGLSGAVNYHRERKEVSAKWL